MAKTPSIELAATYVSVVPYFKDFQKNVAKELGKIDVTSAGKSAGEGFANAFGRALDSKSLKSFSSAVDAAMASAESASKDAAAAQDRYNQAVSEYGRKSEQARKAEKELADAKSRSESASTSLKAAEDKLADAQKTLAASASNSGFDKFSDSLDAVKSKADGLGTSLSDVATGIGLAAGIGKAIQAGIEQVNISGTLKAKLGDTQAAKDAAAAAGQVYAEGWGESLDQVVDTAATVSSMVGDVGAEELGKITRGAIVLSDTMGSDLGETVRAVDNLMTNFGLSSDAAMDLLTAGIQRGLNRSDELADNITEYSGRWADAGLSASQYFSLLQAGMDNGAYSLDKVGDFLNEFLTSLTDGRMEEGLGYFSDGTKDVFNQFKQGKKTAKDVLDAVIGELNNVTDETKRASIASELWSSLGEDNAWTMIGALANVTDSYGDVAGAADEAVKNAAGVEQEWTRFSRTVQQEVGQAMIPVIRDATDFIEKHGDQIGGLLGDTADVVGKLADVFLDLPEPVQIGVGALVLFGGKIGSTVNTLKTAGGVVKSFGGLVGDLFTNAFSRTSAVDAAAKSVDKAGNSMDTAKGKAKGFSSVLGGFSPATLAFTASMAVIGGVVADFQQQSENMKTLSSGLREALKSDAQAVEDYWKQIQNGEAAGSELTPLEQVYSGFKGDNIGELLNQVGLSEDDFTAAVMGSSDALKKLDDLGAKYYNNSNVMHSLELLEDKITELADTYQKANAEMLDDSMTMNAIDAAYSNVTQSVSDLSTTLKANGDATKDMASMTDASRSALDLFGASVWQNVDSIIANADAYGGMDSALQVAKNRVQEMRDALISQLTALGQTPEQAAAVADALGLIPSNVTTTATLNAGNATLEIQAYLDTLSLTPTQKTTFMSALTSAANGDVDALQLNMSQVPSLVETFLNADPSNANQQTNNVRNQLIELGAMHPTPTLDANPSPAENNVGRATTSVRNFGGEHATATVDVRDNASWTLEGILDKLWNIAGSAWTAVVNTFTGGSGHYRGGFVGEPKGLHNVETLKFASGGTPSGLVSGAGSHIGDRVFAALSPDEYVIRASSALKLGKNTLDYMNRTGEVPNGLWDTTAATGDITSTSGGSGDVTAAMLEEAVYRAILRVGPMGIQLDGNILAGELAPKIDRELGNRYVRGLI